MSLLNPLPASKHPKRKSNQQNKQIGKHVFVTLWVMDIAHGSPPYVSKDFFQDSVALKTLYHVLPYTLHDYIGAPGGASPVRIDRAI